MSRVEMEDRLFQAIRMLDFLEQSIARADGEPVQGADTALGCVVDMLREIIGAMEEDRKAMAA